MKWKVDEMESLLKASWQKWQVYKNGMFANMASWQNGKLAKWQVGITAS
jgi:hypothetical protein